MRIRFKRGSRGNRLMVVVFEPDSNFNPDDLSWTPRDENHRLYRTYRRLYRWN